MSESNESKENGAKSNQDPLIKQSTDDEAPADLELLRDSTSPVSPTRDRIAIFIDGANLFYAAVHLQIEIDYTKLLSQLVDGRRLLRPYFYTGVDRHNDKQQGFILWLRRHGYRVITKELIHMPDGSKKANVSVEMAVDMLSLANYCDTLILLSGDGDLSYVVNAITYRGVKVELVSLRSMTNDNLINLADRFIDLADIRDAISKGNNPNNTARN
ncbi:NYN domain-containing protein [filamentous cyanobacterium LEGE 11480]|uniref:NYN domain-containing protein n=2 Tax=Romeriopsis TaxID=2992131 RepID=A0A928VN53_9CYAN|nr:NYN domain-containing protein [Romeriopsis navalis LEGE 11480]